MALVPDLTLHDIQAKQRVVMGPFGQVSSVEEVTYYAGDHGPFYLTYPISEYSAEKARAAMMDKVQGLRILLGS